MLERLQDHATFTRTGTNGVAQVDTEGLIAAEFTHRDSRAVDPDLHIHVAISNEVSHVDANGVRRWLASTVSRCAASPSQPRSCTTPGWKPA